MIYRERILIAKPGAAGGGTQNADTGVWTPDPTKPDSIIYQGACDIQELSLSLTRSSDGQQADNAQVQCFLEDESRVNEIPVHAAVTVTYRNGSTASAEVQSVRRLDGSLMLRYLQ